jgi:UDP-N-acetylmuramoyl-tripeptide--D-alanyl-D-alanine ligase
LELGVRGEEIHTEIGKYLALSEIGTLITVGNLAKFINMGAQEMKTGVKTFHCENNIRASEKLLECVSENDKILIKGSRGMKTEEIVDIFLKNIKPAI